MVKLNLPEYNFKLKKQNDTVQIFDVIRKKYVTLTPEEWVRQHTINYLVHHKNYLASHIAVEKSLEFNGQTKRTDIVVYNKNLQTPFLIVECKAPEVKITQQTFNQIALYNMQLSANYLMVTNGINHFYCQINYTTKEIIYLKELPSL